MRRTSFGESRRRAVATLALLSAVSACGAPDGGSDATWSWAREAEAWVTAYDGAAASTDRPGSGIYYARDVTVERRDETFEGRVEAAALDHSLAVTNERHELGPLHLDVGGFLRTESLTWRELGRPPELSLRIADVGSDDITAVRWYTWAGSPVVVDNPAFDGARADVARVAEAYVRAWSTGDLATLVATYAPTATLRDDVDGIAAEGREAILALADSRSPSEARLVPVGDVYRDEVLDALGASPQAVAVYLARTVALGVPDGPQRLVLLQRSVTPCPGASAVELTLDGSRRVVAERRLRNVFSVRQCASARPLPTGWWSGRSLPTPLSERRTGSVRSAAGTVAVYNGTPQLEALLAWGFDRYDAAGIGAPVVAAVALDPFAAGCRDVGAYTSVDSRGTTITFCSEAQGPAPASPVDDPRCGGQCVEPWGRSALLLHELGHAWLVAHADARTNEDFRRLVGAPSWSDPATPAADRGVEIAASALAWGVSGTTADPPVRVSCALLAEGYRLLTGAEPLARCPGS